MKFQDFIDSKKVVEASSDKLRAQSLTRMAEHNLKVIQTIGVDEDNASIILVQGYECLRQILEAIASLEGYKVYSHEAYTAFLEAKKEFIHASKFDRLRRLRNGVNYYARPVSETVAKQALEDVKDMMVKLSQKYFLNQ